VFKSGKRSPPQNRTMFQLLVGYTSHAFSQTPMDTANPLIEVRCVPRAARRACVLPARARIFGRRGSPVLPARAPAREPGRDTGGMLRARN